MKRSLLTFTASASGAEGPDGEMRSLKRWFSSNCCHVNVCWSWSSWSVSVQTPAGGKHVKQVVSGVTGLTLISSSWWTRRPSPHNRLLNPYVCGLFDKDWPSYFTFCAVASKFTWNKYLYVAFLQVKRLKITKTYVINFVAHADFRESRCNARERGRKSANVT